MRFFSSFAVLAVFTTLACHAVPISSVSSIETRDDDAFGLYGRDDAEPQWIVSRSPGALFTRSHPGHPVIKIGAPTEVEIKEKKDRVEDAIHGRTPRALFTRSHPGPPIIKIGAATEVELKEKKVRVEDTLSSVRAAVGEGVVPGGGHALLPVRPRRG